MTNNFRSEIWLFIVWFRPRAWALLVYAFMLGTSTTALRGNAGRCCLRGEDPNTFIPDVKKISTLAMSTPCWEVPLIGEVGDMQHALCWCMMIPKHRIPLEPPVQKGACLASVYSNSPLIQTHRAKKGRRKMKDNNFAFEYTVTFLSIIFSMSTRRFTCLCGISVGGLRQMIPQN